MAFSKSDISAPFRLLRSNTQFANYIITRFTLIFGLFMQATVISYELYKLTDSKMALGLIGLSEAIPAIGMSLFAGHIVEFREKRGMLLKCIGAYILISVGNLLMTSHSAVSTLSITTISLSLYALNFCNGLIRSFIGPTNFALLPLVVKKEDYPQAITLSSFAWQAATVLGPLTGGFLLAWKGISFTMIIVTVCMILAFVSLLRVAPQAIINTKKGNDVFDSLKQGLKFVFRTEVILAAISLDLFAVLFGGAEALLPVYARDILHVGESGFGWLRSAHGIGSIITLIILTVLPLKTKPGVKLLWAVAGYGAALLCFGISKDFYLSFFLLMLAGMFDGVSVVLRQSILQYQTPDDLKSRVASVNTMFISSSNEIGAFESGLTASMMGTVPAVVFGGCMTILVVLVTWAKAPKLRRLKLQ